MNAGGKIDEGKGRAKGAVGAGSGKDTLRVERREHQTEGRLRQAGEKAEDVIEDVKDALEKRGAGSR